MSKPVVVLADGEFPTHPIPLEELKNSEKIVCCDGAVSNLLSYGLKPLAIVGDCDSITAEIERDYRDIIFKDPDQDTNDLTKAVKWCISRSFTDIVILGATGKREDHMIANISLLAEYSRECAVKILTDTGIFIPLLRSSFIDSYESQQVSIFSLDPSTEITASGLKYPLVSRKLGNWWEGSLNESAGDIFSINFSKGRVILFLRY
jgi:thiamine pyrophosphokinase